MDIQQQKVVNGINISKLEATLRSIKRDPDLSAFRFHIVNEWTGGTKNETTAQRIDGGPQITIRTEPFKIKSDQPCSLMGADSAPCAVVSLLHSLASCLSVSIIFAASRKNIKIDKMSIVLEGDIDIQKFLDLPDDNRPGISRLELGIKIDSNSSPDEISEIVYQAQKHSIVLDALVNQMDLNITLH